MGNDLKGNENWFELTGGSSYRGLSYRESIVINIKHLGHLGLL